MTSPIFTNRKMIQARACDRSIAMHFQARELTAPLANCTESQQRMCKIARLSIRRARTKFFSRLAGHLAEWIRRWCPKQCRGPVHVMAPKRQAERNPLFRLRECQQSRN